MTLQNDYELDIFEIGRKEPKVTVRRIDTFIEAKRMGEALESLNPIINYYQIRIIDNGMKILLHSSK